MFLIFCIFPFLSGAKVRIKYAKYTITWGVIGQNLLGRVGYLHLTVTVFSLCDLAHSHTNYENCAAKIILPHGNEELFFVYLHNIE